MGKICSKINISKTKEIEISLLEDKDRLIKLGKRKRRKKSKKKWSYYK